MINIQNIGDNKCFKWCLARYLNPACCNPAKITKSDKKCVKKPDFKDKKFPVKVSNINKIEKKNSISISDFGYENREKYPNCALKKCYEKKHVDLLLIEEKDK